MKQLQTYIEKLKGYTPERQKQDLLKIIQRNSRFILDLNREQLMHGEDSRGRKLLKYDSKEYADFKKKLNPKGVTDLKLTGAFHESFTLDASEFPIEFGAADEKTTKLVAKYGQDIFGLSEESKEILEVVKLRDAAIRLYKKIYGLR